MSAAQTSEEAVADHRASLGALWTQLQFEPRHRALRLGGSVMLVWMAGWGTQGVLGVPQAFPRPATPEMLTDVLTPSLSTSILACHLM